MAIVTDQHIPNNTHKPKQQSQSSPTRVLYLLYDVSPNLANDKIQKDNSSLPSQIYWPNFKLGRDNFNSRQSKAYPIFPLSENETAVGITVLLTWIKKRFNHRQNYSRLNLPIHTKDFQRLAHNRFHIDQWPIAMVNDKLFVRTCLILKDRGYGFIEFHHETYSIFIKCFYDDFNDWVLGYIDQYVDHPHIYHSRTMKESVYSVFFLFILFCFERFGPEFPLFELEGQSNPDRLGEITRFIKILNREMLSISDYSFFDNLFNQYCQHFRWLGLLLAISKFKFSFSLREKINAEPTKLIVEVNDETGEMEHQFIHHSLVTDNTQVDDAYENLTGTVYDWQYLPEDQFAPYNFNRTNSIYSNTSMNPPYSEGIRRHSSSIAFPEEDIPSYIRRPSIDLDRKPSSFLPQNVYVLPYRLNEHREEILTTGESPSRILILTISQVKYQMTESAFSKILANFGGYQKLYFEGGTRQSKQLADDGSVQHSTKFSNILGIVEVSVIENAIRIHKCLNDKYIYSNCNCLSVNFSSCPGPISLEALDPKIFNINNVYDEHTHPSDVLLSQVLTGSTRHEPGFVNDGHHDWYMENGYRRDKVKPGFYGAKSQNVDDGCRDRDDGYHCNDRRVKPGFHRNQNDVHIAPITQSFDKTISQYAPFERHCDDKNKTIILSVYSMAGPMEICSLISVYCNIDCARLVEENDEGLLSVLVQLTDNQPPINYQTAINLLNNQCYLNRPLCIYKYSGLIKNLSNEDLKVSSVFDCSKFGNIFKRHIHGLTSHYQVPSHYVHIENLPVDGIGSVEDLVSKLHHYLSNITKDLVIKSAKFIDLTHRSVVLDVGDLETAILCIMQLNGKYSNSLICSKDNNENFNGNGDMSPESLLLVGFGQGI